MTLEKGSLLRSRYLIEDTIAAGGMGAVYRAMDETLGIRVAVKENFFSTEEHSRQFRREATILASLRHPNLPRVTDHFVIPTQGQYLVMDFIDGIDLREIIARDGALSEAETIRVGTAISDALVYLHSRNPAIVHRDIKPGNLKITPSGQVVLVDFGLAKLAQGDATTTGAQALTPGYAPPEQYGQGTEPRSDIYALGATLYAALTGKIPEDGLSRAMGSAELTSIRRYNAQVSERLARVIERAMAVLPADRYPTAQAFKDTLLGASAQHHAAPPKAVNAPGPAEAVSAHSEGPAEPRLPVQGIEAPRTSVVIPSSVAPTEMKPETAIPPAVRPPAGQPPSPLASNPRKRGFPLGVVLGIGGVIVFIGIAGLVFGLGLIKPLVSVPQQPVSSSTPLPAALPSATDLPPTVTVIMAKATAKATLAASKTPTLPLTQTPLPANTAATATSFTPTQAATPIGGAGGQIAYSSEKDGKSQVWVINSDGSGNRQVTKLPDGACQPDWSPDGQRLVFISPCQGKKDLYNGASLFIINADGTSLTPLATLPGGDFDPAWSPDGSQVAFTTLRDNNIPHIYLYNLANGSVQRLSRQVNRERHPAWSPDGKMIVYETTRLNQPQIWTMTATGEDAKEFSSLATAYDFSPAWSPDGSIIVFSEGNQPILVARQVGVSTAQQFPVSNTVRPADESRFSPDGWWLAFTLKQDGNTNIYMMTRNGASLKRLTDTPGADFHPAWRP